MIGGSQTRATVHAESNSQRQVLGRSASSPRQTPSTAAASRSALEQGACEMCVWTRNACSSTARGRHVRFPVATRAHETQSTANGRIVTIGFQGSLGRRCAAKSRTTAPNASANRNRSRGERRSRKKSTEVPTAASTLSRAAEAYKLELAPPLSP